MIGCITRRLKIYFRKKYKGFCVTQNPLFFLSFLRLTIYVTYDRGRMSPAYPGISGKKGGNIMFIESFCRMVSGVEKAQKKAAVLFEAGMETSRAFEKAGVYEALLRARILEMRIYRAFKIPTTIVSFVGIEGLYILFVLRMFIPGIILTFAVSAIVGIITSEWLRRKIKVTRLKARRLDRFLARKGSA